MQRAKTKTYPLNQSPIFKLRSRSKLAKLLSVDNAYIRDLESNGPNYSEFDIPKKSGGFRHVENPAHTLKRVQSRLAGILSKITPPEYLYCPVKGRSYVSNAARHASNRVVRTLDIKKYFPSTSAQRVFWFFNTVMQCEDDISGLLTRICTYQGHLPTGSPLSPIMAFYAHYDMWERIANFCALKGYTLTVYVDDCTISGSSVPNRDVWEIRKIIHGTGLRYHKEKKYVDRPAEITGVIVANGKVVPPNRQFEKLHVAEVQLQISGNNNSEEIGRRVKGLTGQLHQIAAWNKK